MYRKELFRFFSSTCSFPYVPGVNMLCNLHRFVHWLAKSTQPSFNFSMCRLFLQIFCLSHRFFSVIFDICNPNTKRKSERRVRIWDRQSNFRQRRLDFSFISAHSQSRLIRILLDISLERNKTSKNSPVSIFILVGLFSIWSYDVYPFLKFRSEHCSRYEFFFVHFYAFGCFSVGDSKTLGSSPFSLSRRLINQLFYDSFLSLFDVLRAPHFSSFRDSLYLWWALSCHSWFMFN